MLIKNTYSTSTQPAIKNTGESDEQQLKDFETLTNITKKIRVFDTDILTYPQLEKEDVDNLEQHITPLENLVKQKHMVDCDTLSDKNFRQNLSDYKAIGLQASQFLDGRECNVTESNRFLEILSQHKLRDNIIHNEQLGVQVLVKFANDQQKKKYLHRIMKGELLTAFCLTEAVLSKINSIQTKGTLSDDKKTWILNGEKSCIINGISADVLIVVALTEIVSKDIIKEPKLTAFIVEKDSPGIYYKKIDSSVEVADITFSDTPVPVENIIGEVNKAEGIITSIVPEFRLSTGSACITLTKKIINNLAKNILQSSNDINVLFKTDAIRGKIGEVATDLYAMESAVYLTSGLIDSYENQDCALESAIVKVFCAEKCMDSSLISLDLLGAQTISDSHWAVESHKEALRYWTLYETNDSLKIIVALLGLQYAGTKLNETVKKLRNPLFYATYILKRMWSNRRNIADNPKLDLELAEYLHPSMYMAAQQLEYCVKRLQFATEMLFARCGPNIVNQHMDLRRLAECIIDIYVMSACVGRASRAYCIGLQHGDYEMLMATTFCIKAVERVKDNVHKIYVGEVNTNDVNYRTITKRVFKHKGYFPKHPLTRNF
ncbi:hypothetical protein NQ314_011863 [Rhamnusium bicolor]|uniref:Acyl-CoA dehydrogenase family member 9, mitochondrial n=1 Tax=Rhamnusium bicolor TaxID=1586634 RepID=A0AAV8XHF8_9CUCU|nr:hypothetical protein NQ314_011863 [Rhamnusium bicolor]